MATNKNKTNEQRVKALLKEITELHPFFTMILRERLQKISEITRAAVAEQPEKWSNPLFNHEWYTEFCNIVDKHLNSDEQTQNGKGA